jgi:hypothetical protein
LHVALAVSVDSSNTLKKEDFYLAQDLAIAETYLAHLKSAMRDELPTMSEAGDIRISYAPFDYIETGARLVVLGITPGLTQATNAVASARKSLREDVPIVEVLRRAKLTASFSGGAMRSNLVAMLDAIGVADLLGVGSAKDLFSANSKLVHFTSALRYPVFVGGKNYNGAPAMLQTPVLRHMVETQLAEEARALPKAVWLPLGPKAESAAMHLVSRGLLDRKCVLAGLPHPSGANAERVAVFLGRKSPALASPKTNSASLLQAFDTLIKQISILKGEFA